MDALAHAWAVLHLPPGSHIDQVRSSYRRLARKWHPDRHASDPRGQAEAELQMKVLNAAYRQLLAAAGRQPTGPAPGPSATPAGRRLSREEIDRLVASIGTESWIESVLPRWGLGEGLGFKSSKEWVFTPFVTLTALVWAVIFELCGRRMPEAVATLVLFGLGIAGSIAAYRAYRRRNDG